MRIFSLTLLLGCGGDKDTTDSAIVGTTTGVTTTSATTTGATTTGGTSTGTTTGSGTAIQIQVADASAACNYDYSTYYTAPPSTLEATVTGSDIDVLHMNFGMGCCPEFSAVAMASPGAATIDVAYDPYPDNCDCLCPLYATYTLMNLPAGTWTLRAEGDQTQVVIP